MSDFGGGTAVVQDAYVDARFSKVFNLRAGKQKPPLGQERLLSATDILFIERALPTALVPNRDVGVQVYGELDAVAGLQPRRLQRRHRRRQRRRRCRRQQGRRRPRGLHAVQGRHEVAAADAARSASAAAAAARSARVAAPALAQIRSGGQLVWFRYRTDGTAPNTTIADGRRVARSPTLRPVLPGPARPAGRVRAVAAGRAPRRVADAIAQQAWQADRLVGADRRDRDRPGHRAAQGRSIRPRAPGAPSRSSPAPTP